jgi:oligopeptidase A
MEKFILNDLENSAQKLQQIINENKKSIEKLLLIDNKTYENFVVPFELLQEKLEVFMTPIYHIDSVKNSELTQKVYTECLPLISSYSTQLSQNYNIYSALKLIQSNENDRLSIEQNKVLENEIRDFELSGCALENDKKKRLEELNLKLSELSKKFSQNLLDATNAWEMIVDEEDVKELGQSDKELAKIEIDDKLKYKFTLQMPSYIAYMTYGNNREKREEIYKAYSSRAPENGKLIEEILKLKDEKVKILGFDNYAQYSLSTKMAADEQSVLDFLYKLAHSSKNGALNEFNEVKSFAKEMDGISELQSYDLAYYSQKLKEKNYAIDDEYYRPYFEQNSVLNGLFEFLDKFFNIKFTSIDETTWDPKVKVYEIHKDRALIGKIYYDLEAREDKRGGAWMHNWHNKYVFKESSQLPSAYVVCNFSPSKKGVKSLLRHEEVVTLFHEMGHALHHLLTTVNEPFVSGINGVAWDCVEFPSQFLEYFAYEKEVLKMFAKHVDSGKVLDDISINKLIKARNFQSALSTLRQVEFALFDFKLYQEVKDENGVQDLLDSIRKEIAVVIPPSYNKFQNGFAHIFAGGYSAGYYSYKWAEVLSADAFYLFKNNKVFNQELALKYRDIILARGGSKDMNELYREFANKEPEVESLLKIDGIV